MKQRPHNDLLMPRWSWKIFFVVITIIWFQLAAAPWFSINGIFPDFPILFLSFFAFILGYHRILLYVFLVGILKDLLSSAYFGLETVSLLSGAVLFFQIVERFDRQNEWVQAWATFVFSFLVLTFYAVLLRIVQEGYTMGTVFWIRCFLTSLYTSILTPLVFPFFRHIFRLNLNAKQYELF